MSAIAGRTVSFLGAIGDLGLVIPLVAGSYVKRRGLYDLRTFKGTKYTRSKFDRHPGERACVRAGDLFTAAPHREQHLSPAAQAALDHATSRVEHYTAKRPPPRPLLFLSERGAGVKKYPETKFHLNPTLIGTIPLENKPPRGTGVLTWNGICGRRWWFRIDRTE